MSTDAVQRGESNSAVEFTSGTGTRIAAGVVGGVLLTLGLRRRSLAGAVAAVAGGWLLSRAVRGRNQPSDASDVGSETDRVGPEAGTTEATAKETAEAGEPADIEPPRATGVERSVTVGKPAEELHELWRDPEQLADIVGTFAEVTSAGEDRYRWVVDGPLGRSVEWETEIVEDEPGEVLRWESVEGATLPNEGTVRFRPAPGDRGTEVSLRLQFDPPGGALGDAAMERLGIVPATLANRFLDRFKSLAETGETPTLEGNPSGRGRGDLA